MATIQYDPLIEAINLLADLAGDPTSRVDYPATARKKRTEQQLIDAWNRGDDNARLELRARDELKRVRNLFMLTDKETKVLAKAGVKTYRDLMALVNDGSDEDREAFRNATGIRCVRCLDSGIVWPNGFREAPWSQRCRCGNSRVPR